MLNNRIEATKILLKANIDYNKRNKDGFTAFELANRLMHFDCAKQIKYLVSGGKVDDVEWIGLFDEDYISDTVDDNDYSIHRARPISMISCMNINNSLHFFCLNQLIFVFFFFF